MGCSGNAGVIRDGLALRLGTIGELMQMRQSQIVAAAEAAIMMQHGPKVFKESRSSAFGEYMRKLEEVRKSAGNGNRPELNTMRPTGNNTDQNVDDNNGEQNGDAHRNLPPSSGIVAGDGNPHGGSGISWNHAKDFTNG